MLCCICVCVYVCVCLSGLVGVVCVYVMSGCGL